MGSGHGAAAIVAAAAVAADRTLIRLSLVTMVRRLAQTAGVRRRSRGGQYQRRKYADQREQQQKSGGQALHGLSGESKPQAQASIEQRREQVQAEGFGWKGLLKLCP